MRNVTNDFGILTFAPNVSYRPEAALFEAVVEKPAVCLASQRPSKKQQVSPLRDDKAVAPVEMTEFGQSFWKESFRKGMASTMPKKRLLFPSLFHRSPEANDEKETSKGPATARLKPCPSERPGRHTIGIAVMAASVCLSIHAQHENRMQHPGNGPNGTPSTVMLSHHLGTDHAEGITTVDMNGDGFLDILSGAYWYENPGAQGGDWKQHQWRTVPTHEEFVSDCGEWTIDVNHDGAPDVVTAGWITNGMWWYENPKKPGVLWQKHLIADSFNTEGGAFADINGDGKPDLALAHYNHSGLLWVDFSGATPKVHHLEPKEADGHGVGIADINGDGKPDLLTPFGWFRNIDADADKWEWHPDWKLGDAGFPILGYDVNGDGRTDLIVGQGHGYGLYWWQQGGPRDKPTWTRHVIDESFSQSHALRLVDIDGDRQPELITGKRYRGHNGGDPGSYDPVVLFSYKLDKRTATWTRTALSMNGTAGAGTQIVAEDFDHDGDIDIATAGKLGVTFLENMRVDKVPAATREAQQAIERKWPFPGEGPEVKQENGPADLHVNDAATNKQ